MNECYQCGKKHHHQPSTFCSLRCFNIWYNAYYDAMQRALGYLVDRVMD